jgi:hypothetical protein
MIKNLLISLTLLVSSLLPAFSATAQDVSEIAMASPSSGEEQWGIQVLASDELHAVLELSAPSFELTSEKADDLLCQVLSVPGYASFGMAGWPDVPVTGALLGIPASAQPSLTVLEADTTTLLGEYDLCPTSQPVIQTDPAASLEFQSESARSRDAGIYALDAFLPAELAQLDSTAFIRSQRVTRLVFQPYQYNPLTRELRYTRHLKVEVSFYPAGAKILASPGTFIPEGSYESILQQSLLNYEQARAWRSQPLQTTVDTSNNLLAKTQPAYKIQVNQDGIYQLSYTDLADAGLPVDTLNPQTLQVFHQGTEVAIWVEGETDGTFDTTDYLLFYGQKATTKYTDTNVYWLGYGESNGLRMPSLDGTPDGSAIVPPSFAKTLHLEQDLNYQRADPSGAEDDHWYWKLVIASSGPAYQEFTFQLSSLPASPTVTLSGLLKGYSAIPYHHTRIYINNNLVDEAFSWESRAEYNFSVIIPTSDLIIGTNTLKVECPRDGEITQDYVLVNWFELDYFSAFLAENDQFDFTWNQTGAWQYWVDGFTSSNIEIYDVTSPLAPQRVLGATTIPSANGTLVKFQQPVDTTRRFLALETAQRLSPLNISQDSPSDLKNLANAADYLIISHASFLSTIQPLADWWSSQGLRVQVVDVQNVYDEFNGGVFSPLAIRDFIAYAYAHWTAPAPSYVLLVGDGNYDYKNFLGRNETNFIPPYLLDADPWVGETAVDNRFVAVSGTDILPDLALGRFPVKTLAEAGAMVNNLLAYVGIPAPGGLNSQLTFVADNADEAGDFAALSDAASLLVPADYSIEKIYYLLTHPTPTDVKTSLLAALNQGRLMLHYSGHASVQTWGSENFLRLADLSSLTPSSLLPLLVSYTCTDGYFINPSTPSVNYSSLVESLVRLSGKGVIAGFAPTGFGESNGHAVLDESFLKAFFMEHQEQIGVAATRAKIATYALNPSQEYLVDTYVLLGDPALQLQTLPKKMYLPLIQN